MSERRHDGLALGRLLPEIGRSVEHRPDDENAEGPEGDQLDHGFHRDGENQAVLVFGGIGVACTEDHGKTGENEGDDQRQVDEIEIACADAVGRGIHHGRNRTRHRFQLEGDIGDDADEIDHRDQHADDGILAVARRDEIGPGGDLLRLGELDDPSQDRHAQRIHQDRPDIDRHEFEAVLRTQPDPAEIGPGRAVDRQAEGVDHRSSTGGNAVHTGLAVAEAGDGEQEQQVA